MGQLRTRTLGTSLGTCAVCGQQARLLLAETRLRRTLRSGRAFDPQASRTVTCQACRQTYPVRSSDSAPQPAADRAGPDPVPTTAEDRRSRGRDWAYPTSA